MGTGASPGLGAPAPWRWAGGRKGSGGEGPGGAAAEGRGGTRRGPAESHLGRQRERGREARTGFRVNLELNGTSRGDCKGLAVVTSDQSSLPLCGDGPQARPTKECVGFRPQSYGKGGMEVNSNGPLGLVPR